MQEIPGNELYNFEPSYMYQRPIIVSPFAAKCSVPPNAIANTYGERNYAARANSTDTLLATSFFISSYETFISLEISHLRANMLLLIQSDLYRK